MGYIIKSNYSKQTYADYSIHSEQLESEQALVSKKEVHNAYSVEINYVNSKLYHDKFEKLPVNRTVQQSLYYQAGRLLSKVDGQEQERMLAVNARTGELIVDNFEREGSVKGTGFNKGEYQKIDCCPDSVIIMHNHSLNGRPSAQDILTYIKEEKLRISLVICHDGTIFAILGALPETENIYYDILQEIRKVICDEDEAKRLATTKLYQINDKLGEKHKLFFVEKL